MLLSLFKEDFYEFANIIWIRKLFVCVRKAPKPQHSFLSSTANKTTQTFLTFVENEGVTSCLSLCKGGGGFCNKNKIMWM